MKRDQMLAMLRHAYEQLRTPGAVADQAGFAEGLIAPVIRGLEQMPPVGRSETMDRIVKSIHSSPRFTREYAQLAIKHAALVAAVKKMHAAKGLYHMQQVTCDLYEMLDLPCVRP